MKRSLSYLLWSVFAASLGCSVHVASPRGYDAFWSTVAQRATFDLGCAQVAVQNIGGDSYGATGCGKKASYSCSCANEVAGSCLEPVCTLEGSSAVTKTAE